MPCILPSFDWHNRSVLISLRACVCSSRIHPRAQPASVLMMPSSWRDGFFCGHKLRDRDTHIYIVQNGAGGLDHENSVNRNERTGEKTKSCKPARQTFCFEIKQRNGEKIKQNKILSCY